MSIRVPLGASSARGKGRAKAIPARTIRKETPKMDFIGGERVG